MDKVAYYKHKIEKRAMARAWKQNIGGMSEDSRKKLEDKGILDYEKEIKGLNKGTENILKKNDADVLGEKDFYKRLKHNLSNKFHKDIYGMKGSELATEATKGLRDAGGYGATIGYNNIKNRAAIKKGDLLNSKYIEEINSFIKNTGSKKIKDQKEKDYLNAILTRHETDEIRHGAKALQKSKLKYGDQKVLQTAIGSHLTPKVLVSESANVAVAPKNVRNFMTKLRSALGESQQLKKDLKYGKSGVFNQKNAKKIEKIIKKINTPALIELLKR